MDGANAKLMIMITYEDVTPERNARKAWSIVVNCAEVFQELACLVNPICIQRIRGFTSMRYINRLFYLLYLQCSHRGP